MGNFAPNLPMPQLPMPMSGNQYGPTPSSNPSYGVPNSIYSPGSVPSADPWSGGRGPYTGYSQTSPAGDGNVIWPIDPPFSQDFGKWLGENIGKGATPFNLPAALPSGGTTAPGQVAAPMNPVMQQLFDALRSGNAGSIPGLDTMFEMSKTGMPIDQTPAWKAMVDSMQRQIGQGAEGLREQFAFGGNLKSTPFGQSMTDYYSQTEKDLNAQLLAGQTGALEAARGRQMSAGQNLSQLQSDMSQVFQGLDQNSINMLLQEFVRTRPEYSPLINAMFGFSTTFPPYAGKEHSSGGLGALLGGAGSLAGGLSKLLPILF